MSLPATLPAYETAARARLSEATAAYFLGHAGAQQTGRANCVDLGRVTLRPNVLSQLAGGSTATTLLGQQLDAPILVAPMAYQQLLHADGECGTAAAATAQGLGMVLSAQSGQDMRDVRAAGENCGWMQLYWLGSREGTLELANRAFQAGFQALVLTVDAPVQGVRDGEIEAGFSLPPEVSPVNLAGISQPQLTMPGEGESLIFDRIAHVLPSWEDVAWLCEAAPLPILLKGITHAADAARGIAAGAAGIIVSNHGGRVLDGVPSSISVLPGVAEAVGGRVPVLMDSGIRRGVDVFRALALGADAVLVGRPVCHGLAVAGAQGASHVLRLMRDELEVAMALMGCAQLSDITRDHVHVPDGLLIA